MNIKGFEQIFHHLQPRLYAYCRKYIDDNEQAKDIVQDCFVQLWENQPDILNHESYLFRAVHNRCISHFRTQVVHAGYEASVASRLKEMEIYPDAPQPLTELYLKDINDLVQHCLEKMPEKCRQIFVMSRFQNMTNQEIATRLNISVRTVEAQIYHALLILKKDLKDYLPCIMFLFPKFFS